ncbi:MAG: hypothetical protein J7502_15225 [Flavisolibacter sp.]|nr:hypothetical protein [Flavisolibacter sp.]
MNETRYEPTIDRQLFEEVYGAQPQAITWMTPVWNSDHSAIIDFEYVFSNEKGLEYLNLTSEQHNGLRVSNSPTLTDEFRKSVLAEMIEVYTSGKESRTNIYNAALNKYARVMRTRLRNGVLIVIEDRTEENRIIKQLEEKTRELQEQKTLLDNILLNSSNGISVSQALRDENGKVIDSLTILANDAAVRFIGLPREIYLTKKATEIEPGFMTSPYARACVHTLETGEPFVMQYFMQSTKRWLELTVSKLDCNHLIHIFTDVTPIKEAQLKLEQSVEELKRSNKALEEFAYAASHDLQDPLRKIETFSSRLKDELEQQLSETQHRLFDRIANATKRMTNLIEDLLAYSEAGASQASFKQTDLNEIADSVLQDLETVINETNAYIEKDPLPQIEADERQLRQLFQNLVSNAIKYRKPATTPEITIRHKEVGPGDAILNAFEEAPAAAYHLIEFGDNGIGFDQQQANKIFNVFYRLHGKSEYEGTGIGLAIVKKVVENHHGFIVAQSEPGKGSWFRILFPFQSLSQ